MVVRIISSKPQQLTCRKCKCELEYEPSDKIYKSFSDYTGDTDSYWTIKCPHCQYFNKLHG